MRPLDVGNYAHIVVLTGAGVSVASGLSPYRGPGGLWEQADIARIADAANLPGTLPDLWQLYSKRRAAALAALPNAAHTSLAEMEQRLGKGRVTLITQNVDGLHQRAGSQNVVEIHGSAFTTRCTNCTCTAPSFRDEQSYETVPLCQECGSPHRPGVVLFGEMIPGLVLRQVENALRSCDLFLSVGTSGVVWPAADFARIAAELGARTVAVNVEQSHSTDFAEEYLGRAEEVLPLLLRAT